MYYILLVFIADISTIQSCYYLVKVPTLKRVKNERVGDKTI